MQVIMKKYVYLIRHGTTAANQQNCLYGHSDVPLARAGIAQVKALANLGAYPNPANAAFYTSGLLRTEQTLALIYGEVTHVKLDSLKEIAFGAYEMKTHDSLKNDPVYAAWAKDESGLLAPPGGESLRQFSERVKHGLQTILSAGEEHSVVVCHGGVVGVMMMSYFDDYSNNIYQWIPAPGHGYTVIFDGSFPSRYEAF